ncbi:MAG: T9SS type A sorting domain-containing protein [Chryseobacterium sp.]|nr:T9SS type A sorting domain-containing protein [Chryseobacterium sp.]
MHPGVEHADEILETLGMDVREIGLNLKIYPNPTPDILYLNIDFKDFRKYSFELLDNSGRSLMIKPVGSSTVSFSMGSYAAGVYLLKVTKNGKLIKIFKVIKSDK